MNTGLVILRLVVALLVAGHGTQKLTYLLGGSGLEGSKAEFAADGFRGGRITALAAGATQLGAAGLLAAGLLTPLGAAGLIGVMLVAASTKLAHGLWIQHDGYEYSLVLAVLGAVLAFSGPGRWSVDHALGLNTHWTWPISVAAVAVGVAGAAVARLVLHDGTATIPALPPRPPTPSAIVPQ